MSEPHPTEPEAMNGATNGNDADGTTKNDPKLDVAIVGGGIVGIILALGLLKRGIHVKIYEQSRNFHEIGAGVAFTANAQRCMHMLDPRILEAMHSIANKNPNDYYQYVDGYHHDTEADPADTHEELLFTIYAGKVGFDGCHRAHFLDELVKLLPDGVVEFRKRFQTYAERGGDEKLLLQFEDGSSAEADLLVGCDGIKSRVRQRLFGPDNPASYAHYSGKVAFRGLIPMAQAAAVLGRDKALNQCLHMGPKAHVLNFPVAAHTMMNVVAFADDDASNWLIDGQDMTAPASRAEIARAFADWGPAVRAIVAMLPEELTKWAIFDMFDHPAPSFARERVCVAGDAAHASSPHHGAGAGCGVEDALALGTLLEQVVATISESAAVGKGKAVKAALEAYSRARMERSQWLVQSSRHVCDVYEWAYPETGSDPEKCKQDIESRAHKIWYFDIGAMLDQAKDDYRTQLR